MCAPDPQQARPSRVRGIGLVVVAILLVAANCADAGESANSVDVVPSTSRAETTEPSSTSTTSPPSTTQPATSTSPSTSTSTSTSTTTAATTLPSTTTIAGRPAVVDPELLAGARVLCTFTGGVVPQSVIDRVRAGQAAGVLLFRANLVSNEQALANAEQIQAAAAESPSGAPAIIAADQEGGIVHRIPGPPTESAAKMGTRSDTEVEQQGHATADNLIAWGINIDLAPVADVVRPGSFEESQHRSFNGDPQIAAAAVSAFVTGLHEGGVPATLKHFPGLGAAVGNTDDTATDVPISADEFTSVDALPFAAGIGAGADLVMMSSAIYPSLDAVPAVVSPVVIGDQLRQRLGFGGVVISDALDTPALESLGSHAEVAVRAAQAGVDLFILGDTQGCVDIQAGVAQALADGELPIEPAQAAEARLYTLRTRLASVSPP